MNKTPLHAWHLENGAKMGAFAGYDMPLYYKLGVVAEHEWVRENAGLFDVSHMGQVVVEGETAAKFFETLTPSAFSAAKQFLAKYTVLTNEQGGIIDDLIVTRLADDKFFAVVNAGCKDKDIAWMNQNLTPDLSLEVLEQNALIAIQGPKAQQAVKDVLGLDMGELPYMNLSFETLKDGTDIIVSRLGYTGEDGFELSIPEHRVVEIWNALAEHEAVAPIGLAARDSLRLDMGYPLYGHDIDDTTSPVEADIAWVVSKLNPGEFFGASRITQEKQSGEVSRKRVGIKLTGRGVAREGAEVFSAENPDQKIGVLTSGSFSPSLKASIGQAYVEIGHAQSGTQVLIRVRGRDITAEIAKMPFVEASTKSTKKK